MNRTSFHLFKSFVCSNTTFQHV